MKVQVKDNGLIELIEAVNNIMVIISPDDLDRVIERGENVLRDGFRILYLKDCSLTVIDPEYQRFYEPTFLGNTHRFFEALRKIKDRPGLYDIDEKAVTKRYWRDKHVPLLSWTQIVKSQAPLPDETSKSLVKSMLNFIKELNRRNLFRFQECLSYKVAYGGQLWGSGYPDEINFKEYGIYGGLILRGDDFSSHT